MTTATAQFYAIEIVLIAAMALATSIAFFLTMMRLVYGHRYMSYDSWIFAMCFAITLSIYDNVTGV